MMKINIKPNLRQFLTDKIKIQEKNLKNVSVPNQNNNFIKQINSHTNSNKNIGKFSLLNSIKDKDNKKIISKLISTNIVNNDNNKITTNNHNNKNYNFNNNNSFLKETQDTFNKFRKSKTTEKANGNKNVLKDFKENQNNKNKKIMIKQSNGGMKRYNLSINKIPKYDNSSFNQVIKYYTLKSESKTIQIEELSTYLRPIRNILGFANKVKTQSNITNSININNDYTYKTKNHIYNDNNSINSINSNKEDNENKSEDKNLKLNINENNKNDNKEETNTNNNNNKDLENGNDLTFGKKNNIQRSNNLINGNKIDINNNNILNNQINTALIKNCVFNNISHTQRNNKFSPIPFNIKIDKINNMNNIKNIINTNSENNRDTNTNNNLNNNINSKDVSEIDTQISTNNNNINHDNKGHDSQALYQYRPRKMNLPKSGINLSSMQFKNKILQNILNKRKQNK